MDSAKRPRGKGTGPARPLTGYEIVRLTAAASLRDRALIWCCLGGGLRVGEACSLVIGAVDPEGSILIEARQAKGRRSRRIFLSDEALIHLHAWMATLTTATPASPVFPSRKGGAHIKSGSQLVEQLMLRCGIRGASSHSLRRTHATGLRDQGSDLLIARAQLGHASIATTEIYLQAYPCQQREEVRRLKLSAERVTGSVSGDLANAESSRGTDA